ncbi:MAG: hypothetical protein NTW87_08365, partial [Planctomycetota bacterium]|nr:hypothetical protein [Planctomycetota bacterium]
MGAASSGGGSPAPPASVPKGARSLRAISVVLTPGSGWGGAVASRPARNAATCSGGWPASRRQRSAMATTVFLS